jgi:hypothetical protein
LGGDLPSIFLDKVSSITTGARAYKFNTQRYAKAIKIVKFGDVVPFLKNKRPVLRSQVP